MSAYNGEQYIEEQLESLWSQSRAVDELVIIDDCSKDSTVAIAERL